MGAKGRRKKPEVIENNRKRIEKIQELKKKKKSNNNNNNNNNNAKKQKCDDGTQNGNDNKTNGDSGAGIIEAIPVVASHRETPDADVSVAMAYCKELKMVILDEKKKDSVNKTKPVSVFGGGADPEKEEGKKAPSESSSYKMEDTIRAMAFSKCGKYFAVSGDDKKVRIFEKKNREGDEGVDFYYSLVNTRLANKKVTSVTFTLDSKHVVYSDKYGDMRVSEVLEANDTNEDKTAHTNGNNNNNNNNNDAEGGDAETGVFDKLLLGHTGTVVTSVCVVDGITKENIKEEFVCTADREGKIRVTRMPPADLRTDIEGSGFDIQSFCFGHEGFVAKVVPSFSKNVIVSGGGDGTIRAWDCLTGKQISKTVKVSESPVQDLCVMQNDEDENIILLVAILENNKKFSAKLFINELMEKDDQSHLQIVEESATSYGAISSSVLAVMDNISEEEEGIEKKYVKCLGRVGEETAIEIKILEEEVQRGIKASEFLNSQF